MSEPGRRSAGGADLVARAALPVPDRPFHHFLQDAADRWPDRVAVRFEDKSITFAGLADRAARFAHALVSRGVKIGDRVALCAANRIDWITAQQGISMTGGASVLVNSSWRALELEHAFSLTSPRVVVADKPMAEQLVESGLALPALRICLDVDGPDGWLVLDELVESTQTGLGAGHALPVLDDLDLSRIEVLLPFSSGTTGLPKAVRHSHRSLVAGTVARVVDYAITDADRLQFFMPMFTIYGVIVGASVLASGASLRLFRRFDAEAVLQNIQDERITITFGSAPVAVALRDAPLEKYDLSSVRYMMWGATPVIAEVAEEITRRSGLPWLVAYGTTETGVAVNPVEQPERWRIDTPGPPMSGIQVRVVDGETGEEVARGEQGEIVLKSPSVMMGYLPEEETAAAFLPDGWLRTGDIGWVEDGDWIHITDRAKEMIKVSGFQVAPAEVERVLFLHPAVADCAVYGMPDARRGEVPKAAVVVAGGLQVSADELRSFVAERLATYKHLGEVAFVESIPRNAGGKVLRRILRDEDLRAR